MGQYEWSKRKRRAPTSGTRLETSGSPARGAGSNCRLRTTLVSLAPRVRDERWDAQSVLEMLVNFHDRSLVATSVAVVWRREDGHDISIV